MYRSRQIAIGNLTLGGGAPIRVQSMTNTDTLDTRATADFAVGGGWVRDGSHYSSRCEGGREFG